MSTDYVLFIHGVKTHSRKEFEEQAHTLLKAIQSSISDPSRDVKPIFCFWGDINLQAQKELIEAFNDSSEWKDFWFRDFRTEQILEFVGDGALYLSRHIGAQVVRRLKSSAAEVLKNADASDRLHLVTHSWGTIILFDILFARRWEDPKLDADASTQDIRQVVGEIRDALFGLTLNPELNPSARDFGIPLYSIQTMGSPIALFSLLNITGNVNGASTHDLTPRLSNFLEYLHNKRKKPIPWINFAHPGDPIAYPLEGVMKMLLKENFRYVKVQDVMMSRGNILIRPFSQMILPLLWGGKAHGSYWNSSLVVKTISEVIQSAV
jgi:hypothetical protein